MQRLQHGVRGFVHRVVVAVAERESGRGETAGAVADEVDDALEFGGHDEVWLRNPVDSMLCCEREV
jgi:hypothetical protein